MHTRMQTLHVDSQEELAKEHTKAEELRKEVEKEMQNDALASQPLSGLPVISSANKSYRQPQLSHVQGKA